MTPLSTVFADFGRFVLFRPLRGDVVANYRTYLLVGLAITWIVGFGRTWDNPNVPLLIRSGVTSIFYAFALSLFIWLIVLALKPERWSFGNVLLMVTMTALPGLIYAAPVEMFLRADVANAVNMIFLAIVAIWRMGLYYVFLGKVAKLPPGAGFVAWLLPPTIIVAAISTFGFLDAIATRMGGAETGPGEISASVLMLLMFASWLALPPLAAAFLWLTFVRRDPQSKRASRD